MSLLLSRLFKLSSRKTPALRRLTTRFFSTSSSETLPTSMTSILRNGDRDRGYLVLNRKIDDELVEEMESIGSPGGWVATLKEGVLECLQEYVKTNASDTDPKRIALPPPVTLPRCQTKIVTNVAMSSFSPEDEDCVVAVKFLGPQLSFCRPARGNSEWTNIEIMDPCFFNSHVMYSERDEMLSMPASGGDYIGSWDLGEDYSNPKMKKLHVRYLPELVQSEWQLLDSYCTSEHLVEFKPTGKTFLVKWYTKRNFSRKGRMETQRIMVFQIDDAGNAAYTKDIGDLAIILRYKAYALCAETSGQYRNVVFFNGVNDFGRAHLDG